MLYCTCLLVGGGDWGGACGAQNIKIARLSLQSSESAPASECCPLLVPRGEHLQSLVEEGADGGSQFVRTKGQTLQVLFV
jgi:hypothetical protein